MQRIIKDLSDKIGFADTIEIVRRWGGRRLYIPVSIEEDNPLAIAIGLERARRLSDHYGGQQLELPAERNALLELRNAEILRQHRAGKSMEFIALQFGVTRQAVGYIIRTVSEREAVRQKFAVTQAPK